MNKNCVAEYMHCTAVLTMFGHGSHFMGGIGRKNACKLTCTSPTHAKPIELELTIYFAHFDTKFVHV